MHSLPFPPDGEWGKGRCLMEGVGGELLKRGTSLQGRLHIARLNRKSRYRIGDPEFIRTANLVTCQTPDGKIRNFYAERVSNCRKPLLAKVLFKSGVASLL